MCEHSRKAGLRQPVCDLPECIEKQDRINPPLPQEIRDYFLKQTGGRPATLIVATEHCRDLAIWDLETGRRPLMTKLLLDAEIVNNSPEYKFEQVYAVRKV